MESGHSDSYFYIRKTMDLRSYSSALTVFPFQVKSIVCYLTMIIARLLKEQANSPEAFQIHSRTPIVRIPLTINNLSSPTTTVNTTQWTNLILLKLLL